ncbi:MAG: hypothetical protein EZS28_056447, partial [Streblomastix strix]
RLLLARALAMNVSRAFPTLLAALMAAGPQTILDSAATAVVSHQRRERHYKKKVLHDQMIQRMRNKALQAENDERVKDGRQSPNNQISNANSFTNNKPISPAVSITNQSTFTLPSFVQRAIQVKDKKDDQTSFQIPVIQPFESTLTQLAKSNWLTNYTTPTASLSIFNLLEQETN